MPASYVAPRRFEERGDRLLVALVENPLFDLPRREEARIHEDAQVLRGSRLRDAELLADQHAAHAVLLEIAVDLRPEVAGRILEPVEDLQALVAAECLEAGF